MYGEQLLEHLPRLERLAGAGIKRRQIEKAAGIFRRQLQDAQELGFAFDEVSGFDIEDAEVGGEFGGGGAGGAQLFELA